MVTYASEEAQKGFAALPEVDQEALKELHQTEAEAIHGAMQSKVSSVLESSESAEILKNVRNYGRPPEDFGIDIVLENRSFSRTVPECAESTEDPWVWFFNYPAIEQLIKNWVQIPSEERFLTHINAIPGDTPVKARIMNPKGESFPGHHGGSKACNRGNLVYWWVTSSEDSAHCVSLRRLGNLHTRWAEPKLGHPTDGFLAPFLPDNK